MNRSHRFRRTEQSLAGLVVIFAASSASAQATPLPDGFSIGAWTFRPSVELRMRGEYRHSPFDVGGSRSLSSAVLALLTPLGPPSPPVRDQWQIAERAQLGIAVDREPVTGVFVLQDSRPLVGGPNVIPFGGGLFPGLAPSEGYIDIHTKTRSVFFRLGRQKIVWGDGRLVGNSDWSATPRSFDAARFGFAVGDFDVDLFAALLEWPNSGYLNTTFDPNTNDLTLTGAIGIGELYGLNGIWHALPLLQAEVTIVARVVERFQFWPVAYTGGWLTPGNTFVFDARVSGEQRGFRYSAEGAYELGSIGVEQTSTLRAFAGAARASLETALPAHLTFGMQGAYASGETSLQVQQRFDPIVPETHTNHGRMGLYTWSNLIEGGVDVAARPIEKLWFELGYRFVGLASPKGRWTSASLTPIGSSSANESHILGHEIDLTARFIPWNPITFEAGYGLFLTGEGAKNILQSVGRGRPGAQHFGYLQATLHAP